MAAVLVAAAAEEGVVTDGATAMVDENTAAFWAATGGAPSVLAPVFLAVSCMACEEEGWKG